MLRQNVIIAILTLLAAGAVGLAQPPTSPTGDYLGQPPPGPEPRLFAPGIVSTGLAERDVAITPDGNEIYFSSYLGRYTHTAILVVRRVDGRWLTPEVTPFSADPQNLDLEPALSADGKRLFFLSNRPDRPGGKPGNQDIWVVDRSGAGWGQPYNLGAPVNTAGAEYFPSLTRSGTLYFTREDGPNRASSIYRSRLVDGKHAEPERLPDAVNSGTSRFNAFVAPDESFLVYAMLGRSDSLGSVDYYVAFRGADDSWSAPVNLGPKINAPGGEGYSPYISPDGKYFFFMSTRPSPAAELFGGRLSRAGLQRALASPGNGNPDIWWVDASFLQALRPR